MSPLAALVGLLLAGVGVGAAGKAWDDSAARQEGAVAKLARAVAAVSASVPRDRMSRIKSGKAGDPLIGRRRATIRPSNLGRALCSTGFLPRSANSHEQPCRLTIRVPRPQRCPALYRPRRHVPKLRSGDTRSALTGAR